MYAYYLSLGQIHPAHQVPVVQVLFARYVIPGGKMIPSTSFPRTGAWEMLYALAPLGKLGTPWSKDAPQITGGHP